MGLTKEHYLAIRNHFIFLLGNKCQCGEKNKDKLHIHHKNGTHLINGYKTSYQGRGRDIRAWDLFKEFENNNLKLLCKHCHIEEEKRIRECK